MTTNESPAWEDAAKWVRIYSLITLAAVVYGLAAAHVPFIIGHPWSNCESAASKLHCVLVFHLYEVPLVSFHAFIGWYGLKRYGRPRVHFYLLLLGVAVIVNLAFFTFESLLLLDSVREGAPGWENLGLTSIALVLITGAGLGVIVGKRILAALYPRTI
ncbi:MAG TPA: hypothetical protein VFQ39_18050 [Longimicrobium sp.]|nr:hypothetical protein [Longimicrobium sp.]